MKSRIVFFLILVLSLAILLMRNSSLLQDRILDIVVPIKNTYKNLVRSTQDRSRSYIFQKENIERLTAENKKLRTFLLQQANYLEQVSELFKKIPSLEKLPYRNIELVDTISYVRLNSYNEIMLSKTEKLKLDPGKTYGLIQNDVVGGTAEIVGDHLYGYLTSSSRCKFGVLIGPSRSPGIAVGLNKNTMAVKYIPKWSKIKKGDKVETSGLDNIFFANMPVGIVKEVKIEDSYKTAYIQTYNDTLHPNYFFLVTDATPYLISSYDKNNSFFDTNATIILTNNALKDQKISSIPSTIQTKERVVDPDEFEIPKESTVVAPPSPPLVFLHPKPKKPKQKRKPKRKKHTKRKKPATKTHANTPATPDTTDQAQQPPEPPQPKKKKSAMDFINGRGF